MKRILTAVLLVGLMAGLGHSAEVSFPLTGENTKLTFVGTKPGGRHDGGFGKVTGSAKVDPADATTLKIAIDIDTTSLFSDNNKLTNHLKSPDFFGVKDNPKARFVSSKVTKEGRGYSVTGK